ncbi:MAG: ATP-binding protein [Gallionellaceae bacterium]
MNNDQQLPRHIASRLRTLEILDQITQLSLTTERMEDVLSGALDLVLQVFNADRAWFLYPCDPDASFWAVPMERTRAEWPGLFALGVDMPMDREISELFRELLRTNGTIQYGPKTDHAVPPHIEEQFSVKSQVMICLQPKIGGAWVFGIHHCASAVMHDQDELNLFTEIAHRIIDSLSISLSIRELRENQIRIQEMADFALQRSERHLIAAQSIAHIGSWDYDLTTTHLVWSDELYRIFGVSRETFMPSVENLISLIHPDDQSSMKAWIEACASGQEPKALEFRRVGPDGTIHYIEGQGSLLLDAEGRPTHMYGTGQDITERKQTAVALRKSAIRYQLLFESSRDALLIMLLASRKFIVANEAALELFGATSLAEITTLGPEDTSPERQPDGRLSSEKAQEMSGIAIREGSHFFEWVHKRLDGQTFDSEVLLTRMELEGEVWVQGSIRDITERKKNETALIETMHKLEEKELAKTRFLAAAGHDLRQPLCAVSLYIDTLKLTEPTPQQDKIIQRLDQSMDSLNGLLDALLNISKLESGMIKPKYGLIKVTELFNWLKHDLAPLADEKSLGFRLYLPMRRTLWVCSDIGLVKSVLSNLVSNAIKFTSQGAILISARRRRNDALFQIWDTGIGIPDGQAEHIFDEFYQVNNPQRDRTAGLGLGLSIAQRSIALLDGRITIRSQFGRGSVFEFRLPLADTSSGNWQDATASQEDWVEWPSILGKRFVVVEDDEGVMQSMIELLEGMGSEASGFHSAADALHHVNIEYADYFIVDYMLGGALNGIQFLNLLRQRRGNPIKAVLVTGDTSSTLVREAAKLDWPVLYKPVNMSNLISCLCAQEGKHF